MYKPTYSLQSFRYISTRLHSFTSKKTMLRIVTAVRTPNPCLMGLMLMYKCKLDLLYNTRYALLWVFAQRRTAISYRHSGQHIGSISRVKTSFFLENGTERLFRNVGKKLPSYTALKHCDGSLKSSVVYNTTYVGRSSSKVS